MKIEIISGSYGWRKTKDAMPKLVERGGICEVDEAEARRLVALGVAAIVHEADEAPVASGSTVESGDTPLRRYAQRRKRRRERRRGPSRRGAATGNDGGTAQRACRRAWH